MARFQKLDVGKLLGNVPEQYVFYVHDGRILRNMDDLNTALGTMPDETYAYHANEQKNDFSNWVKDIIGDEKLARDLNRAVSRAQAAKRVATREAFLTGKLNPNQSGTISPAVSERK